jgi:hypothetical protein
MRVLGTQIDVAVLMGARALPEKPDPEAPLSSCFVVSKANEQFSIRVAVSTTVPEPIMAAVSIDGQPLKHNYPIYRTYSSLPDRLLSHFCPRDRFIHFFLLASSRAQLSSRRHARYRRIPAVRWRDQVRLYVCCARRRV